MSIDNTQNTDIQEEVLEEDVVEADTQEVVETKVEPKWYVLHTYSGYESMVKDSLVTVFGNNNMADRLYGIEIPMEDVTEEKNGKRRVVQRKKFPCYVYIYMVYDNSMWHMITNTRGVTGFVGPAGRPVCLTEAEVKALRIGAPLIDVDIAIGDAVKVCEGPLQGFVGVVESVDTAKSKCKVIVSMFGRDTSADLELSQIEKV